MKPTIIQYDASKEFFFKEGCWINELSNSNEDPGLSVAQATVSPGSTTKWHKLHGVIERYVILEGEGIVEAGAMPSGKVTKGDTVLIPAGRWQRITNTGESDLVFLAICTPRFDESVYEEKD